MSVWTYNPIEAQREVVRRHENEAAMHQKGVDFYAAKRGHRNAATADKFRALVKAHQGLALEARDKLADMIDAEAMRND